MVPPTAVTIRNRTIPIAAAFLFPSAAPQKRPGGVFVTPQGGTAPAGAALSPPEKTCPRACGEILNRLSDDRKIIQPGAGSKSRRNAKIFSPSWGPKRRKPPIFSKNCNSLRFYQKTRLFFGRTFAIIETEAQDSASRSGARPTPRPLSTEKGPPYTTALAATCNPYYTVLPR